MLSLSSLLNPISTSEPRRIEPPPSSSYYSNPAPKENPQFKPQDYPAKAKMSKDGAVFSKGKIKGRVMFPPSEILDQDSLRAVRKFKVFPLGEIAMYPRHIPYNSEKKSFLEKTGRESFEVFQYTFQVPNDDKQYTVMWDYNVGLVRITPFFKCCKYSKTTPAKMLNMNPGLKEITHSITGGALAAQGYWMPFPCARAICATFCAHISGALIPLFGPTFPSTCVPLSDPLYSRMIIDPSIIRLATEEALAFRTSSSTATSTTRPSSGPTSDPSSRYAAATSTPHAPTSRSHIPTPSPSTRATPSFDSVSPRTTPSDFPHALSRKRLRLKRGANQHPNASPGSGYVSTSSDSSPLHRDRPLFPGPSTPPTVYTPPPPSPACSGWTATNAQRNFAAFGNNAHHGGRGGMGGLGYGCTPSPEPVALASPWLSAVPREGTRLAPMRRVVGVRGVEGRREGVEEGAYDADSDGSSGGAAGPRAKRRMGSRDFEGRRGSSEVVGGESRKEDAEKSAALMLMSLSVGDGREMHGVKRKRPASL